MKTNTLVLLIAWSLAVGNASAHHSFVATYDRDRPVELPGVVVDFVLKSPHSLLLLDVTQDDGGVEHYEVEMASLAMLRRLGFDQETFLPGDEITVTAWPHRRSMPIVWARAFALADGRTLRADAGGIELTTETESRSRTAGLEELQGRWSPVSRRDVNPLPLTPAGQAALETYEPQQSPAAACEPNNVPAILHAFYLFDIRMTDTDVVLRHEAYNVTRTVPFGSQPRLAEPTGLFGTVSGRIDGEELVIESRDYPESDWGLTVRNGQDVPSSGQKRVTERYAVAEDGNSLTISYTMEDPVYLTEPYTGVARFVRVADDEPMYDYTCEPDSASRFSRDQ